MVLRSTERFSSSNPNTYVIDEPPLDKLSRDAGGLAARLGMLLIAKANQTKTGRAIEIERIQELQGAFDSTMKEVHRLHSIENGLHEYATRLNAPQLAQLAFTLFESHGQMNGDVEIQTSPTDLEALLAVATHQAATAETSLAGTPRRSAMAELSERATGFRAAEESIGEQVQKLHIMYDESHTPHFTPATESLVS